MFKAMLIICGPLFGSQDCLKLEDTQGPYNSRGECIIRVIQMFNSTQLIVPPPYESVKYKCEASY